MIQQKITPFLWFEDKAEEAAKFYVSIFKNSQIGELTRYDEAGAKAAKMSVGSAMIVEFELAGQKFLALNGGRPTDFPSQFTGAISFLVECETQEEVDWFWEKLSQGGEKGVCGWINRDKFGVTWQVVPTILSKLLSDPDKTKAGRVMEAMLKMTKIKIDDLKQAYAGS